MKKRKFIIAFILTLFCHATMLYAKQDTRRDSLSNKEKSIVRIASTAAKGDLDKLKNALNKGLDDGLAINQIKETIIHLYAYAGFPRSIRSLQTLMAVSEERKAKGINDQIGPDASPIRSDQTKYERGKAILEQLTGIPEKEQKTGYTAFAPTIELFLKEHLFADIFERDVLNFKERELVTISVLSAIGGVEPMLQSHLKICLNVGLTPAQLHQFVDIIRSTIGEKEGFDTNKVLNEVLKIKK